MIGPDDFDEQTNRPGLWTDPPLPTSIGGSSAMSRSGAAPAQAATRGSRSLRWLISGIVLIGIIAFVISLAQQQRRQEEMRIQQEDTLRDQERREAAAAEEIKRLEAEEAKRQEEERKRQEQEKLEQAEVVLAEHNSEAFAASERASSLGASTVSFSVLNRCQAGDVDIVLLYHSISAGWVTAGWWTAKPNIALRPAIWPTNENIYFFAERSGFTWEGEGDAPQRYIVSNVFTFKDDGPILGRNKRLVKFRLAPRDAQGRVELVCRVNQ